ncbi:MAG TPA: DNA primase [Oligoflexia bacterium]|nr:DNA primase [Oligoflexia bacterium]HMP47921.1 DNA primase [Oligoflexia bacterium]
MRYADSIIEEIKNRTSLVELVNERSHVKQSGRNFSACCPFHLEKTPSFNINEEQGLYYCFGCGKKGNTFTFVMETRGMTFPEAVRFLASRTGIILPAAEKGSKAEHDRSREIKHLYNKILVESLNYFEDSLWGRVRDIDNESCKRAREYLSTRGISEDSLKRYRVGYAHGKPGVFRSHILNSVKSSLDVSEAQVEHAMNALGLLRSNNTNSSARELFRERVIFPICRSDGQPIAFGGRTLVDNKDIPKYINSPESPVYEKRRSFFGLPQALSHIKNNKNVLLVEGYTDVISLQQSEVDNVLAVCGTALTEDHARILSRFVNKVRLVFDGDVAGRLAAARTFPIFINSGLEVIPVFLPEGEDPDSLSRKLAFGKITKSEFLHILSSSEASLLRVFIEAQAAEIEGLPRGSLSDLKTLSPAECGKLAEKIAKVLAKIRNPVALDRRLREASSCLGSSEEALRELVKSERNILGNYNSLKSTSTKKSNIKETGKLQKSKFFSINDINALESKDISLSSPGHRRMEGLKRQLVLAAIVDPSILANDSVQDQLINSVSNDERLKSFFATISDYARGRISKGSSIRGLSQIIHSTEHEAREIMAELHALLCQCGLENENFLEEALRQMSTGGSQYDEFISELSLTIERLKLTDYLDVIRTKEGSGLDESLKLELAQEKLLKKRKLDQLSAKMRS